MMAPKPFCASSPAGFSPFTARRRSPTLSAPRWSKGLGFYPGAFWSLLLSCTEFFGGILIAIGLLTRPAAFAGMIVLLVTVWFHWITVGQGFSGAEKSLLWAAILLFFVIRGGNRQSFDARIGEAF